MKCLSETYPDSSNAHDDQGLNLNGHKLIHNDNPSNNKRGGVVFILRNFWPSVQWIHNIKYFLFAVSLKNKKGRIVSLYR